MCSREARQKLKLDAAESRERGRRRGEKKANRQAEEEEEIPISTHFVSSLFKGHGELIVYERSNRNTKKTHNRIND